jgi:hypothetical protein
VGAKAAPRGSGSLLYKLVAGSMGLALLGLAGPQLSASILRLYAQAGLERQLDATPPGAAAGAQLQLLRSTDDWFGDPDIRILAGLYGLRFAYGVGVNGQPDPEILKTVAADLSTGLARSPGNPWAWAVLGEVRLAGGDRPAAIAALKASMLLGPNEPPMAIVRSELGLRLWPDLDTDARRAVVTQMRLAWDYNPNALVAIAKANGGLPVMIALAQDPVRLSKFMKAYASRP